MKGILRFVTAVLAVVLVSIGTQAQEAVVKISARNLNGYNLSYHRSYNGVWLRTFTPIELDADSTTTISMDYNGLERMIVIASDPRQKNQPAISKSFYVMPGGVTNVIVDPSAKEQITVSTPSGNPLDATAAESADSLGYIWFAIVTGRNDELGISADSVPTSVTTKLDLYIDSLERSYTLASPEISAALNRDARLGGLMVYLAKCRDSRWEKELSRMREDIGISDPDNARSPFFSDIMGSLFFIDVKPGRISPDSLLQINADYLLATLEGKAAEATFGRLIYDDGDCNTFSPSALALTDRFKKLFPESGLIPFLDEKAAANLAFNSPKESDEIIFLDNSSISSLSDILTPYRGKPVLIDLWATWCGPCRKSFEHVKPILDYAAANDIQLLYLSVDEEPGIEKHWKKIAQYYNLKGHHVLINPAIKQEVYTTFGRNGIISIPRYAIVDRNGHFTLCEQHLAESTDFAPLKALLDSVR